MANIRIKDLPQNIPVPSSWVVAEVVTTPGVTTTSKSPLSAFVAAAGLNYRVWQSTTNSMTALSAGWQNTTNSVNISARSWNSATTTLSTTSAFWSAAYNTVISFKPLWDIGYTQGSSSYTTVRAGSASWSNTSSVITTVNSNSANWSSVYTNVNTNSGSWGRKYSATFGDGVRLTYTVNHNLNTQDVITQVYNTTTYAIVTASIINTDANNVTLGFSVAPSSNSLRAVVIG